MKFSCCLALATASAVAGKTELPSFDEFLVMFNKTYSAPERENRKSLYEERLKLVHAHNSDKTASFQLGINQFSDLTNQEFKNMLGTKGGHKPLMTSKQDLTFHRRVEDLPDSIDWRTKGVITPVKNQGSCGSCWAFAATETIESHAAIDNGAANLFQLAPQQLVSCSTNPNHCGGTGGCQGSIAELAYDYAKTAGLSKESSYPYTSGSTGVTGACATGKIEPVVYVTDWIKLQENNYTAVMNAIATVGPLAVNVAAEPWQSYSGGVYDGCPLSQNIDIDHVVQLVGYGTDNGKDYWLVRNSWGASWGEAGYIRVARQTSGNYCGTDKTPQDGTGCSGGPPTVTVCGTCGIIYDVSYPHVRIA